MSESRSRQDAINELTKIRNLFLPYTEQYKACQMAIRSLEAWDIIPQLQSYKLFEGDVELYINMQDIANLLAEVEKG